MYLKVMGCLLILGSSSLIGFLCGENLKKRVVQLKEIEQALYQLQNEITYTHTSLPEIFLNVSYKCTKPISDVFKYITILLEENKVDSVYDAFKNSFSKNKEKLNLKQQDLNVLLDLSKTLGESDIEGQRSILNLTINNLKKQLDSAEKAMNKNIKMYRYLGFSFGAIIIIMIL